VEVGPSTLRAPLVVAALVAAVVAAGAVLAGTSGSRASSPTDAQVVDAQATDGQVVVASGKTDASRPRRAAQPSVPVPGTGVVLSDLPRRWELRGEWSSVTTDSQLSATEATWWPKSDDSNAFTVCLQKPGERLCNQDVSAVVTRQPVSDWEMVISVSVRRPEIVNPEDRAPWSRVTAL
jgi:hypothetical protein